MSKGARSPTGPGVALPPRPEDLNRVLIILESLAGEGELDATVLCAAADQQCLGAHSLRATDTLEFAVVCGLAKSVNGRVAVTELGLEFLAHNPGRGYELGAGQAGLLVERCMDRGPWHATVMSVLAHFKLDRGRDTFSCNLRALRLDKAEIAAVSFMRAIGLLDLDGNVAYVIAKHRAEVSRLWNRRSMSPEELEDVLARRSDQGAEAEEFVLAWERSRLEALGCRAEADTVWRISTVNVCAGYDLASFNGTSQDFSYDRFIEVKSTSRSQPEFVLTRNELEVAKSLGQRYWLYVVSRFGHPGVEPIVLMVQNPARALKDDFDLQCLAFRGTPKATPGRIPHSATRGRQ